MQRKDFLKGISAAGITGGLFLSGCSTGADPGYSENNIDGDSQLIQSAAEREAVAIQTYTAAANAGVIEDRAVLDTAVLFKSHHEQHLDAFNNLLTGLGGSMVYLNDFQADQRISDVGVQSEAIELAMKLEWEAAYAYFTQLISQLQTLNPRALFANIFPVEASHFVALKDALGITPAINSGLFEGLDDDHIYTHTMF